MPDGISKHIAYSLTTPLPSTANLFPKKQPKLQYIQTDWNGFMQTEQLKPYTSLTEKKIIFIDINNTNGSLGIKLKGENLPEPIISGETQTTNSKTSRTGSLQYALPTLLAKSRTELSKLTLRKVLSSHSALKRLTAY